VLWPIIFLKHQAITALMHIVITIPAYNEEKTIAHALTEIKEAMQNYNHTIHVLDDGSTDNTAIIARSLNAKVTQHPRNFGLAEAFREELKQMIKLKADIIIHTDADLQYPAAYMPSLITEMENGYDLVLGSRFLGKIQSMPIINRLGNKLFSKVISQLTGLQITDAQTGFRAFTRKVATLPIISNHTYTQEQIIKAAHQKMKIKEIPIYARKTRKSKLISNPLEYAFKAWINILRVYRDFAPLKFFGSMSIVLFVLSFLTAVSIGIQMIILGVNVLDRIVPTILLAVLFFLSGLQILLFGFLADKQKQ